MPVAGDVLNLLIRDVKPLSNLELFLIEQTLKASSERIDFNIENLLHSLALTLECNTFRSVASQFFLVCISLVVSHYTDNEILLDLLNKGGKTIDEIVKDAAHALISENIELLNSLTDVLCHCVVFLAMSTDTFNAETILTLLDGNVRLCTIVLLKAFSNVTGSKPGISPLLKNLVQRSVVLRLILSLRNLCSWKIYHILSEKKLRKFKNSNGIPLNKVSGSYRHFISVFITFFMGHPFFEEVGVYFDINRVDNYCEFHQIVSEFALLIDNLITLTDQYTIQLRKHIFLSRIFERLFIPFLRAHTDKCFNSCTNPSVVDVLRSIGTFALYSKGLHALLVEKQDIIRSLLENLNGRATDVCYYGLLFHLTRIIINTDNISLLPQLTERWNTINNEKRQRLLVRLTTHNQFNPIHTKNQCFDKFCNYLQYEKEINPIREKNNPSRRRHRRRRRYARLKGLEQESRNISTQNNLLSECDSDSSDALDIQLDLDPSSHIDFTPWRKGPPPSKIPLQYICALTHRFIQSVPVISPQGCIFDKVSILSYLKDNDKCPITGEPLQPDELIIDYELNEQIQAIRSDFITV